AGHAPDRRTERPRHPAPAARPRRRRHRPRGRGRPEPLTSVAAPSTRTPAAPTGGRLASWFSRACSPGGFSRAVPLRAGCSPPTPRLNETGLRLASERPAHAPYVRLTLQLEDAAGEPVGGVRREHLARQGRELGHQPLARDRVLGLAGRELDPRRDRAAVAEADLGRRRPALRLA